MNRTHLSSIAVSGAVLLFGAVHAASAQVITNGDFEAIPTYSQNVYVTFNTTTTTASFIWSGYSGVVPNSNLGFFNEPAAPSGVQVAFLQGYQGVGSTITQTVTGFTIGQRYTISGFGAQRGGGFGGQTLNFSLFGVSSPVTPTSSTAFNPFTTTQFLATATSTTFQVATTVNGGDSTAFFDKLTITAAPEPASIAEMAAFALPMLGLVAAARRRKTTIA